MPPNETWSITSEPNNSSYVHYFYVHHATDQFTYLGRFPSRMQGAMTWVSITSDRLRNCRILTNVSPVLFVVLVLLKGLELCAPTHVLELPVSTIKLTVS